MAEDQLIRENAERKLMESELRRATQILAPFAEQGIKIVCLEPSSVSVFRDELRALFPHDEDGKRIRAHVRTLSELLDEEKKLVDWHRSIQPQWDFEFKLIKEWLALVDKFNGRLEKALADVIASK